MLNYGSDGCVGHRVRRAEAVGHHVLIGDAKLRAASANQGVSPILRRLLNVNLQALIGIVALSLCDVDSCVVGVGRVVKHEGELRKAARSGAARRRATGGSRRGTAAATTREHGARSCQTTYAGTREK